ncbi:MAG: ATPase V, partial [Bacteroidales bacterium]|nr:ATPase V [Bacteroidales bacterium]
LKSLCIDGWFPDGKIAGFPAQMVLAVGIGIIHICLAMIVKAIGFTKRFGIKSTISTWGWTLLIVGGIVLTALGMMEVLGGEALKWSVIALAVISGLAIYVFNTPGRNPLKNIGSGLWDTYNMVTGLLGDVLSYIRLYALGLAGGMLGNAFNIMGTMILDIPIPGINWIFCIVVLIFGHILNLAMSCLGAFVHPLRLTFVEYFKNSGYEGTGTAYNPLANNKTN